MATNMPPLIGEPSKRQTSAMNWTMIGLFISQAVLPIALQLKELFKKQPQPTAEKK